MARRLPQINPGLVCALPGQVPLAYRLYPGSLADSTTLPNTIAYLQSLGITRPFYIMDRGFGTQRNLQLLLDAQLRFILPIPFSSAQATTVVGAARKTIIPPPMWCVCINGFCITPRCRSRTRPPR